MITISQRECHLGAKYSGKHHEAKEGAPERQTLKLQLEGIEIDETEFNALFQDAHAWQLLRDTKGGPALKLLQTFELKDLKLEGAHLVLWHSLGKQKVELKKVQLSKFTLTIADDAASGATTLSLTVEGEPPLDVKLIDILTRVGTGIEVEIRADHPAAQEDLPLNTHGTGEQPERPKRGGSRGRKFGHSNLN